MKKILLITIISILAFVSIFLILELAFDVNILGLNPVQNGLVQKSIPKEVFVKFLIILLIVSIVILIFRNTKLLEINSENKNLLDTILNGTGEGIILADEEGKIVIWNKGAENILGIPSVETIDKYIWEIYSKFLLYEITQPQLIEQFKKLTIDALNLGKSSILNKKILLDVRNQSGKKLTLEQTFYSLKTEKGFRLASTVLDVTEYNSTIKALRKSEEKFFILFSLNPELVVIARLEDNRILDCNDAFKKHLNFTKDKIIGMTLDELDFWHEPIEQVDFAEILGKNLMIENFIIKTKYTNGSDAYF